LRKNQTIRAILGSFLLLMFVVGITPKRYWHDMLADHKDSFSQLHTGKDQQVNKPVFNCDWNMQVATSPFTQEDEITVPAPLPAHSRHYQVTKSAVFAVPIFYHCLRGPPAIG